MEGQTAEDWQTARKSKVAWGETSLKRSECLAYEWFHAAEFCPADQKQRVLLDPKDLIPRGQQAKVALKPQGTGLSPSQWKRPPSGQGEIPRVPKDHARILNKIAKERLREEEANLCREVWQRWPLYIPAEAGEREVEEGWAGCYEGCVQGGQIKYGRGGSPKEGGRQSSEEDEGTAEDQYRAHQPTTATTDKVVKISKGHKRSARNFSRPQKATLRIIPQRQQIPKKVISVRLVINLQSLEANQNKDMIAPCIS